MSSPQQPGMAHLPSRTYRKGGHQGCDLSPLTTAQGGRIPDNESFPEFSRAVSSNVKIQIYRDQNTHIPHVSQSNRGLIIGSKEASR